MATPTRTTEAVVLVGREGHRNNVFNFEEIQRLISSCDAPKDPYTVVSIIGPQSGGKSTLMNGIFNTKFTVMDESIGRGRTTKGIWASICNDARAIVLDVEGTDSVDNQDDLGFETRTALFSLVISDVIFINMWLQEVNRAHGNPLLKKIFEEVQKRAGPEGLPERYQTKIVFAVRNYNGRTPETKLKETIMSNIKKIWMAIPQKENSKFENYFKLHVELFPDLEFSEDEFYNKCEELRKCIDHGDWVDQNVNRLHVSAFPSLANELWEKILENKTLDLPSQMEMAARETCDKIVRDKFQHFCNTEYVELARRRYDDPKQFEDNLRKILDDTISDYNNQTHLYGKHADEKKMDLTSKILYHAEQEFMSVMEAFQEKILVDIERDIISACGKHTYGLKELTDSVVSNYHDEFVRKTEGLVYYNKLVDRKNFMNRLELLGETRAYSIKKENIKELVLRVTTGVLAGVSTAAATLATLSPLAGPWAAIVGLVSSAVSVITAGAATLTGKCLAESKKGQCGAAAKEGNTTEQKYLSKIMEAGSRLAELSDFQKDVKGNAVALGHKLGSNILLDILGTQTSGEFGGAAALLDQSTKSSTDAAVEAGDKLGGKLLSTIMGDEASGFDFGTTEDVDRYVGIILKGLSEGPLDKAP